MSKSNAQRQAAYRSRHLHDIDGMGERLNTVISVHAKCALERLASCYGVTQRAILERLIREAERSVIDRLAQQPHASTDYYDKRLRLPADTVTA